MSIAQNEVAEVTHPCHKSHDVLQEQNSLGIPSFPLPDGVRLDVVFLSIKISCFLLADCVSIPILRLVERSLSKERVLWEYV